MPKTEKVRGHLRRSSRGVPHPVRGYARKAPVYYHVTSDRRLPLILEKGLLPSGPETGANYEVMRDRGRSGYVYLATDPKTAEFFGSKRAGYRGGEVVVLEVNARGLPVRVRRELLYNEAVTPKVIPPQRLRVVPTWFRVKYDKRGVPLDRD